MATCFLRRMDAVLEPTKPAVLDTTQKLDDARITEQRAARAPYGKRILATVSQELTSEFGQAFTLRSLYRAIQFCQGLTDQQIVSTLSTQLSWSHFVELLPSKDPLARDFYAEMCRIERWDVRTLQTKIGGMQYVTQVYKQFVGNE